MGTRLGVSDVFWGKILSVLCLSSNFRTCLTVFPPQWSYRLPQVLLSHRTDHLSSCETHGFLPLLDRSQLLGVSRDCQWADSSYSWTIDSLHSEYWTPIQVGLIISAFFVSVKPPQHPLSESSIPKFAWIRVLVHINHQDSRMSGDCDCERWQPPRHPVRDEDRFVDSCFFNQFPQSSSYKCLLKKQDK